MKENGVALRSVQPAPGLEGNVKLRQYATPIQKQWSSTEEIEVLPGGI